MSDIKEISSGTQRRHWGMIIYLLYAHVGAFIGCFYITQCKWQTLIWTLLLLVWSGIGVTGGVHRLWAHRSYKAHWTIRTFLMLAFSTANQGSIYHWARDHRTHHKFSETDADPHNAKRGFVFAHVGWLVLKKDPKVVEAGRKLDLSDLEQDPVVAFQRRLDPFFNMFMCFIFPTLVSYYLWEEGIVLSYLVAGCLRYCYVLHATWLVNSAAHLYGSHPYDTSINPAENKLVAFFAVGEGWHNWHHTFPYDYAASEFGADHQYNPTKMFIDVCAWFGLVNGRKRALGAWNNLKLKKSELEK